ncbi:MAG: aldehyde ferredoxin oxidoreductase family protein [Chloroflexi bacterium]|nr:aldehyde ferredoxin oxidoreductase family protein [Chloroflexota bacterium]
MSPVYAGRYLNVNLTNGTWRQEQIADDDVRQFLLGSGYAAWLHHQTMDAALPPLDTASPLYVFNGLFTGSVAPTGCRTTWCGRSPLTGIWGESNVGGHWGAALRAAGYDGLVVTGRAEHPVYLWMDGRAGTIELRRAGHLWGQDCHAAHGMLLAETDAKAQVAVIGPAGENLVHYAAVMIGGPLQARAAGRGGTGAIMGSKNLKAIVVRGGRARPAYHDADGFRQAVKAANHWIQDNSLAMSKLGTAGGLAGAEAAGDLPVQNWRGGSWSEGAQRTTGQALAETLFSAHHRCFACPIGCGKQVEIKEGRYAGLQAHSPEYETLAGFGGLLLNDDLHSIVVMDHLCNRYGLDTISTAANIAFAFEAYEKGLLSEEDTGGLELRWGDAAAAIELIQRIARRQGLGDLLADGVRAAAARLGPEAERFALHVKGQEFPYHDPRAFVSMAANYATANRGACHLEALSYWRGYGIQVPGLSHFGETDDGAFDRHDSRGKGAMAARYQDYMAVYNPLGLCKFIIKGLTGPEMVAEWVNLALGWDWTTGDVFHTGERIFNLKRLINAGYGIGRADDTLPQRFLSEPRPSGGAAGALPDLELMLEEYYATRGWDPASGHPTTARLGELGLQT